MPSDIRQETLNQQDANNISKTTSANSSEKAKYIDSKAYSVIEEVLNATTHGIGFVLAIIATVFLIFKALDNGNNWELGAYIIYGSSMMIMFLGSTLYHSLKTTRASKVFQIIDHSNIFLLIAGTYTPYCFAIGGWIGWTIFAIEWIIAIVGIVGKATGSKWITKRSTWLYIAMGWVAILAIIPLVQTIGLTGSLWLLGGGVTYTVGAVIYALSKKFRWPHGHVLWHIFVVVAAAFMWISIYFYA